MNQQRFPEEFKVEAAKQVLEHGHSVADVSRRLCIDPAVSAQVRPLMQMPQREFSCSAPDADADGCKSQSSPR